MGGSNILGLIFEIAADPSKAQAALDAVRAKAGETGAAMEMANQAIASSAQVAAQATARQAQSAEEAATAVNATQEAMRRTVAQSLKEQGASIAEAEQAYKQLGLVGVDSAAEIKAAFGEAGVEVKGIGAATEEASAKGSTGIRGMFPALSELRSITRLAMGAFAVGFIISDFGRLVEGVVNLSQQLGGLDLAYQQISKDALAGNQEQLEDYKTLTVAQQRIVNGIKDEREAREQTIKFQIANAQISQEAFKLQRQDLEKQIELERQSSDEVMKWGQRMAIVSGGASLLGASISKLFNEWRVGMGDQQKQLDKSLDEEKKAGEAIVQMQGALARATQGHTRAVHEHADALAQLLQREREEAEQLDIGDNKRRQAIKVYDDEVRAIDNAVAAAQRSKTLTVQMENEAASAKIQAMQNLIAREKQIDAQEEAALKEKNDRLLAEENAFLLKMQESVARADEKETSAALAEMDNRAKSRLADLQDALKISAAFDRLAQEEDRYSGRAERDAVQVAQAHKQASTAAAQRLVAEARVLSQLTGDWNIYSAAVRRASEIIVQAEQDQASALQKQLAGTGQAIAGMLGLEKEFVIAEAAFEIPKNIAKGLAALAMHDGWAAANYFASAAEWGVAAGQAVAALVSGGGSGPGSSSSNAVTGGTVASAGVSGATAASVAPMLAPGALGAQQAALNAKVQQPTVIHMDSGGFTSSRPAGQPSAPAPQTIEIHQHFEVNGPVYGDRAAINDFVNKVKVPMARALTDAVTNHDVKLISSHVVNPAPVSRGRT